MKMMIDDNDDDDEDYDCLKSFYTSVRKKDGSYYKTSSMKSICATIDRFLRSPPHCKQFSIIGYAAFTEANKVIDAFVKDLRKTGKSSLCGTQEAYLKTTTPATVRA